MVRKEVKDIFGRPGTRVEVGSARKRPLAAHDVGARQQEGLNLKTGHLSRHYIAEISLNATLNHNKPKNQKNLVPFWYRPWQNVYELSEQPSYTPVNLVSWNRYND